MPSKQPLFEFFKQQVGIKPKEVVFYVKWVQRFLSFFSGTINRVSDADLQAFKESLECSGLEEWQVFQALRAAKLYVEKYTGNTIVLNPSDGNDSKSQHMPVTTWHMAKDRFIEQIRLKHYAYNTEKSYREWIRRFILFTELKSPLNARPEHVRSFLAHLAIDRSVASSTQNQAFHALLFLYRNVLNIDIGDQKDNIRARQSRRIPVVFTEEEVVHVFKQINGDVKLPLTLIYASGLRVKECVSLRVKDLDFGFENLNVRNGKGNKDRTTLLPGFLHESLKIHLETVKRTHENDLALGNGAVYLPHALERKYPNANKEWGWQYVFPASNLSVDPRSGIVRRHHLDVQVLQRAFRRAVRETGINKQATVHTLRHTFATQLLISGYDIRTIQELLGHKDVKTTMIYTHVIRKGPLGVKSPAQILSEQE